jgi:hypothetical protein
MGLQDALAMPLFYRLRFPLTLPTLHHMAHQACPQKAVAGTWHVVGWVWRPDDQDGGFCRKIFQMVEIDAKSWDCL